jgi:hypothetical protein
VRIAALVAALVLVIGSFEIGRPGYSVDEEFTEFAVRGIRAHGLPILPSGLLYDRGLAYSYASAIANGRVVSLICGALLVVLTFALVRRHVAAPPAWLAALLVATSVPFWATATTARFYAPFLLLFLAALGASGTVAALFAIAFLARLTHELAFLLALVPLLTRSWRSLLATVGGLLSAQAVLFLLHAIDPPRGETMVRQFFLWQVVNLFERPGDRQFGIAFVVMALGVLLMPKRKWLWTVSALSVAAMIIAFSIARATNSAPLSAELVMSTLREGSRYPLDMLWHIARTTPLTLAIALFTLVLRAAGAGGEWRPAERAAHLLWIGWVAWFGVIESGITTNYLLLPISFMLIAIAVDVDALGRAKARPYAYAAMALLVMGVALDQWRGEGSLRARLEAARPTIHIPGIEEIRDSLQPGDRVVCTDELGCLMLVSRIDRWLALDDYVRERFLVRPPSPKASTSGKATVDKSAGQAAVGVYTGAPAIFRPGDAFGANEDGTLPDRTIVVDIFKDYPIGNSRSWLPKAIEEDGLRVTPLLETPQARVLQVSPPERVADSTVRKAFVQP